MAMAVTLFRSSCRFGDWLKLSLPEFGRRHEAVPLD